MAEAYSFLANTQIGIASGWDIVLGVIFLVGIFLYGFFLGRNRMIVLLLGTYFSWAIVDSIPWTRVSENFFGLLDGGPSSSTKTFIFIGLVCLFYFLIPRSVVSSPLRIRKKGEAVWWQVCILSVVQIGLLATAILSFMAFNVDALSPIVVKLFVGDGAVFVWTAVPIFTLLFMRRSHKQEK